MKCLSYIEEAQCRKVKAVALSQILLISVSMNRRNTEIFIYIVNILYVFHSVLLINKKKINEIVKQTFVNTLCNQKLRIFVYACYRIYILNLNFLLFVDGLLVKPKRVAVGYKYVTCRTVTNIFFFSDYSAI